MILERDATASPDRRSAVTPTAWVAIDRATGTITSAPAPPSRLGPIGLVLGGRLAMPTSIDAALEAIELRGEAAFAGLRGSFFLAVENRVTRDAWLVRDPTGTHPLFYAETPTAILCAPRIADLLAAPGVRWQINRVAVADHLCQQWPDKHETLFDGVRRLPAGWLLHISGKGLALRRYWNPAPAGAARTAADDFEAFDALLDQAVARQRTDHDGLLLSGGFDSVSVAAVAVDQDRRTGRSPLRAWSLGFGHPSCDERDVQRRVARGLGVPLELVEFDAAVGRRGLIAEGLALNHGLAAPLGSPWAPAFGSLLRRAAEAGASTVFTGDGGDEWLGTTPYYAADLMRRGDAAGLVGQVQMMRRSYRQPWPWIAHRVLWTFGARPLLGQLAHRLGPEWWDNRRARKVVDGVPSWLASDAELRRARQDRARRSLAPADPAEGFYERECRVWLDHAAQSCLVEEQFELGRRAGVTYARPYWDADLVSRLYRMRPERLIEGGRAKALVRQTVARRFPGLGFERQKKVVALDFFVALLQAGGPRAARDVGAFPALTSLGVVDGPSAAAFVDRAWHRGIRHATQAWLLLNTETWARQYVA